MSIDGEHRMGAARSWTAGFALEQRDGRTRVTAQSRFEPEGILIRIMGPIVRRRFHQTQQAILAALKRSVESAAAVDAP